jgi:dimethylglycine dehydrogenase
MMVPAMKQDDVPVTWDRRAGLFEIEVLGQCRPARINFAPPFDPAGEKTRG